VAIAHPLLQVATIRAVRGVLPLRPSLSSLSSLADRCGTHYRPVSQVVPRLDTTPGERDAITDAGSEVLVAANSCTVARPRGVRLRRALRRLREEQDRVDTTPPLPRCALRLLPVREATRAHCSPHANAGFVFYVLPRAFVIHCPHLPSVSRQNWQLFRDKKDELFRSFIREHL